MIPTIKTDIMPEKQKARANDIVSPEYLEHELMKGYREGFPVGESTGMGCLDENLRLVKKGIYLMFGVPNMGKSEFVRSISLHKALKDNWHHVVYCYEEENYKWLNKVIWGKIGRSTLKQYHNRCNEAEFVDAMKWALEHYTFIYPESGDFTIENIEAQMETVTKGKRIDMAILDPINQVELPSESDSNKWSSFYMGRKHFARKHNLLYFLVAHPPKTPKGDDGEFKALDLYDVSGGAMHANKVDCMINYHRPFFCNDKSNPLCEIRVLKTKDVDAIGKRGEVPMNYNYLSNRYTDMDGNDFFDHVLVNGNQKQYVPSNTPLKAPW